MSERNLTPNDLAGFTGTEGYLRWNPPLFPDILLTDGARYVAETAGAFWLMDIIGSYWTGLKRDMQKGKVDAMFQTWTLRRNPNYVNPNQEIDLGDTLKIKGLYDDRARNRALEDGEPEPFEVICDDSNGNTIRRQRISLTDFPVDNFGKEGFQLFAIYDGEYLVILLPSEY